MRKALIIGAGNQGRGILGMICRNNGLVPIFMDTNTVLLQQLRAQKQYTVEDLKQNISMQLHCGECIDVDDLAGMCQAVEEAELIFTSVSSGHITECGAIIGKGLSELYRFNRLKEKNIILCENSADKISQFLQGLQTCMSQSDLECVQEIIGICEALSMSLASHSQFAENELQVEIQQGMRLYINKNRMKGDLIRYEGIRYVDNYEHLRLQALYTNNTSSACIGYLGHLLGYRTLKEAMADQRLQHLLVSCYDEINLTLIRELGVSPANQKDFSVFARKKYEHSDDRIERHCKGVLRKLGKEERLSGICEKALKHDVVPKTIALGLAAALFYNDESDEESKQLALQRERCSLSSLIETLCQTNNQRLMELIYEGIIYLVDNNYLCQNKITTKLIQSWQIAS